MSSSNSTDSSDARWTSQGSALALTTCSLSDLAAAARQAAAAIGHDADQRYGTHKVFLAAVHAALGGEDAIDLEAFKRRMVSAHRAGLVMLARADLVAAMPYALRRPDPTTSRVRRTDAGRAPGGFARYQVGLARPQGRPALASINRRRSRSRRSPLVLPAPERYRDR